jgi:hypothetical protein
VADEVEDKTPEKPDPKAPGSNKFVDSIGKQIARGVLGAIANDGKKSSGGDPIMDMVNAAGRRKPANAPKAPAAESTTTSGKTIPDLSNFKVVKVGAPKINTGNEQIDYEVTRVVSQVAGVLNEFQSNTAKAFRLVGRRLKELEEGTTPLKKNINLIQKNQKTIADQMGLIFKELDRQKSAVSKPGEDPLEKKMKELQDRAASMKRDEKGRFLPRQEESGSSLLGNTAKGAGAWGALKMLGKRIAPRVGGALTIGTGLYALDKINDDKKELAETDHQENVQKYGQKKADVLKDVRDSTSNPLTAPFHTAKRLYNNMFGSNDEPTDKKNDKNNQSTLKDSSIESTEVSIVSKTMMTLTAEKDITIKGKKITIDAEEIEFKSKRVSGLNFEDTYKKPMQFRKGVGQNVGDKDPKIDTPRNMMNPDGTPTNLGGNQGGGSSQGGGTGFQQRSGSGPLGPTADKSDMSGRPNLKGKDLPENLKAGTVRMFHAGGNLSGVDKSLVTLSKEASKDLPPGYRAEMISGRDARSTGTTNHPNGIAMDIKIYDDKGNVIPHDRGGPGMKLYEQFHQSIVERGKVLYPDNKYIWGGTWVSAAAGNGDPMHNQRFVPGVGSQSSGAYNDNKGAKGHKFEPFLMDDKERSAYKADVAGKAKQDYIDPKTGKVSMPDEKEAPPTLVSKEQQVKDKMDSLGNQTQDGNNPFMKKKADPLTETLSGQRKQFMDQIEKNPQLKQTAMAMMMAEEGGDSKARKSLLETVLNRSSAHGYTDLDKQGFNRKYYEPFMNGSFNKQLAQVMNNPELRAKLEKEIQEVGGGSNHSNLATQNASGAVARNARETQSVASVGDNKEHFTRKDREEYAGLHGSKYTAEEKAWYNNATSSGKSMLGTGGFNPLSMPNPKNVEPNDRDVKLGPNGTMQYDAMGNATGLSEPEPKLKSTPQLPEGWAAPPMPSKAETDKAFDKGTTPVPFTDTSKAMSDKETVRAKVRDDTTIRSPRHDVEASGPTPGSDGYGSGACDPDGGGICSV